MGSGGYLKLAFPAPTVRPVASAPALCADGAPLSATWAGHMEPPTMDWRNFHVVFQSRDWGQISCNGPLQ